jgi:hypothetical protein
MVDMLKSERDDASEDLGDTQTHVPKGKARCLFTPGIVLATDEHQRWANSCLEDTEKHSGGQETAIVVSTG